MCYCLCSNWIRSRLFTPRSGAGPLLVRCTRCTLERRDLFLLQALDVLLSNIGVGPLRLSPEGNGDLGELTHAAVDLLEEGVLLRVLVDELRRGGSVLGEVV